VTDLLADIEESIRTRKLLPREQSVIVAVSGGLDSMVLLHLLHKLSVPHRWRLIVAHYNHQLRGRSSNADERLVRQVAKSLGLPCVVGRGSVKSRAQSTGQSLEMAARDLRHTFLAHTARRLKAHFIALAHHADDQVELFFLRLLRGAGGEGLAGMKWQGRSPVDSRVLLVRPMLGFRRLELAEFAHLHRIKFREDASNASMDHFRNRIRHELLPLLESDYRPGLAKSVLRSMDIIGSEAECVTEVATRWLSANRRAAFGCLPPAVQRRCLLLQLQRLSFNPDFQTVEWLREKPNCLISLSSLHSAFRDQAGMIRIRTLEQPAFHSDEVQVVLKGDAGEKVFGGVRCQWRLTNSGVSSRPRWCKNCEYFDADSVGERFTLRYWRPGDRFQPIGMANSVKLQDCFTNQKIPVARRRELVVAVTAMGQVFWVEGLRISERFKLNSKTRRRLTWRWKRA